MRLRNKLGSYLSSNNLWILLIVLLYISFNWVMTFRHSQRFSIEVYLHSDKWWLFGRFFSTLCSIYAPALIYGGCRSSITISKQYKKWLWAVVFIAWPVIIGFSPWSSAVMPVSITTEVVGFLGILLLAVELLTRPQSEFGNSKSVFSTISKVNLDWWVLLLVIFASFTESIHLIQSNEWAQSIGVIWPPNLLKYLLYFAYYLVLTRVILPSVNRHKRVLYTVFAILGTLMIFYVFQILLLTSLPDPLGGLFISKWDGKEWIGDGAPERFSSINHSGVYFQLLFLATPMALFIYSVMQMKKLSKAESQQVITELQLLKQQINPHFFFNTLNNVYALSLEEQEKTSESILQLSELMRYVIYSGSKDRMPISAELNYLNNYISLQQIRSTEKDKISFDSNIQDPDTLIAPLMLINLLENAFKHGLSASEQPGYIKCHMTQRGSELSFSCTNSVEIYSDQNSDGIGLSNLRRRLDLIYPNQYELKAEMRKNEYHAQLNISL